MQIDSPPAMHFNDGIQEFLTKESIESIFFLYLVILKIGGWGGGVGLLGVLLRGNQCREAVSGVFEINGIKFTPSPVPRASVSPFVMEVMEVRAGGH